MARAVSDDAVSSLAEKLLHGDFSFVAGSEALLGCLAPFPGRWVVAQVDPVAPAPVEPPN